MSIGMVNTLKRGEILQKGVNRAKATLGQKSGIFLNESFCHVV